jgi:hypothetical protein
LLEARGGFAVRFQLSAVSFQQNLPNTEKFYGAILLIARTSLSAVSRSALSFAES